MRRRITTLATLLCAVAVWASGSGPRNHEGISPAGHWVGTIDAGDEQIEFIVDVDRGLDGSWLGEVDIPAQGVEDFPLDVQMEGSALTLSLTGVEWRGELSADGTSYTGTLQQDSHPAVPFNLRRTGTAEISDELRAMTNPDLNVSGVRPLSADGKELREQFNSDISSLLRDHNRSIGSANYYGVSYPVPSLDI